MANSIGCISRQAYRDKKHLNILTAVTHEPYECNLTLLPHRFYAWQSQGIRTWNSECREIPLNYHILNGKKGIDQIPVDVNFDLVLSHNRFGQFQILDEIAKTLHIPHINMEHTLPMNDWKHKLQEIKKMKADINLFITDYNRDQWQWKEGEAKVLYHGIDTETFRPVIGKQKERHILSVCNDFINRDWCCGYSIWKEVTQGLPVVVRGNTPGLSTGTKSTEELLDEHHRASVFLNTSTVSPVPMSLLEAMASGMAVVSTATCSIPEIIKNGINGFITNDKKQIKFYLEMLLENPELCAKLGQAARKTIETKFSLNKFLTQWQNVFEEAVEIRSVY